MELDRIEKLLEKYFQGATSIAEEKELKDYFTSSNVAPTLEHYKPLFSYAIQAKHEQFSFAPFDLQSRLSASIALKTKKRLNSAWLSVAASLVVLLAVALFTFNQYNDTQSKDLGTIDDPKIAFRETQKALDMISKHVNKGLGSMSYINEYEQSKNKIFK